MEDMTEPAISISEISYGYPGQSRALISGLNLQISQGSRFGLFGPNGAGKTTLMNCMTGVLRIQTGEIKLLGKTVRKHDKSVNSLFGFVPQDFSLYLELSPVENLAFFGAWYGLARSEIKARTEELLAVLGLEDARNKQVREFSGGMKRRVNLAIGVIHKPRILFLDEPTVGVDVQTRHAILEYLKVLNAGGTTLVYTSHQLYEAEALCNDIAMMDQGKIITRDNLSKLMEQHHEIGLEGLFIQLTGKEFRD